MPANSSPNAPEPVIRVFISSTFLDMQEERDLLVKRVFPELRRRCRGRGVELVEVDLRWGITEEQSHRGETLRVCLAEIERCRPYFLALLGERYGWVPPQIAPDLIRDEPWLGHDAGRSVTEIEILHAVLNDPAQAPRAFFYLRDPEYVPAGRPADGGEGTVERLQRLKSQIRASGFPVRDNYRDPASLAEQVTEDLWAAIDEEFPQGAELTPMERDRASHAAFASSRTRVYIARPDYFTRLDSHAAGGTQPLVVLGDAGSGKSALLSNWSITAARRPGDFIFQHFIGATPHSADYRNLLSRLGGEIQQWCGLDAPIPSDPKVLMQQVPAWLSAASQKASATGSRVVLIFDGLDQLEDQDRAPDLVWLPSELPAHVRVFVSTLPGRSLDAASERGWPTLEIAPLHDGERRELITSYLAQFRKTLDPQLVDLVSAAPQSANPLYLRILLDELRIFGTHELLPARLRHYLRNATVEDLYQAVLARLEDEFDHGGRPLVREACSALWAARRGLSENELLEILAPPGAGQLPRAIWSPLYLALEPSLVVRSGLITFFHRDLRLAVQRRYLTPDTQRKAAHLKLADYFSSKRLGPIQSIEDFDRIMLRFHEGEGPQQKRCVDELPWQLLEGGDRDRLRELLSSADFQWFFGDGRGIESVFEQLHFWNAGGIRDEMAASILEKLRLVGLDNREPASVMELNMLGIFIHTLQGAGDYKAAEPFMRRQYAAAERLCGPEHLHTMEIFHNFAGLLNSLGLYAEAEEVCRRSVALRAKVLGPDAPRTINSESELALILQSLGKLDEAERIHRKVLEFRLRTEGPEYARTILTMGNLGLTLSQKGDEPQAEEYFRTAFQNATKALGKEHPDTLWCMGNLASSLEERGDLDGSESLYQHAWEAYERVLGWRHWETIQTARSLGRVLIKQGKIDVAEAISRRALAAAEEWLGPVSTNTLNLLGQLGDIHHSRNQPAEALPYFRRAAESSELAFGSERLDTLVYQGNYVFALLKAGEKGQSLAAAVRLWHAAKEGMTKGQLQAFRAGNLTALVIRDAGDYSLVESIYRHLLPSGVALGSDHPELLQCFDSAYGSVLLMSERGDAAAAISLLRGTLEASEKIYGPAATISFNLRAKLVELYQKNGERDLAFVFQWRQVECQVPELSPANVEFAEQLEADARQCEESGRLDRAEMIRLHIRRATERGYGPDHPKTAGAIEELAGVYCSMRDFAAAAPLYDEAFRIYERIDGPGAETATRNLMNGGAMYRALQDWENAESRLKRGVELATQIHGLSHEMTLAALQNLMGVFWEKGDLAEAAALCAQLVQIHTEMRGADHPETLEMMTKEANLCRLRGDLKTSAELYNRVAVNSARVLGSAHPDTLQRLSDGIDVLEQIGEMGEALRLRHAALDICERRLGATHTYTLIAVYNLARALRQRDDLARALPLFERALAGFRETAPPDHPLVVDLTKTVETLRGTIS